ncbi:AAA family ATPase [Rivihabitans pingtungensis]|uniref:AAA family ATPase n=1 Tax=Rivihabitans pingtungensis TaxID=1054498 RepID=UPI00289C2CD1|nr:AAA family ATPase [Rivihabitans pingtungensis]
MQEKIKTLLIQLNHGLVERENTLKAALLTVLAGENLLLIGPPGTGKSLIARRIADCLSTRPDDDHSDADYFKYLTLGIQADNQHDDNRPDTGYFEYLLTKFSTPEEIFGPLSITELKADRFRRNTAGYLPTVQIAFLDEIFKASSSILNALLTILNERVYHNGAEPQAVPLQALIAASNELPSEQEELSALYDRFLVRVFVDYVSQDNLPRLFDKTGDMPALRPLSRSDLHDIRRAAEAVTLPPEIIQAIQRIWAQHKDTFKEDRRESLSDRRLKKLIKLLSVSAASNGRDEVDLSDVMLLKDCLWNHQDNAVKVREMVFNTLRDFSRQVPQDHGAEVAWADQPQASAGATPKIKGYKGSGTAHDPLLIENIHDLAGLARPEVGQQGYYFRQTADIDCSGVSTWAEIPLEGHYDGGGYTIKGLDLSYPLFSHIWEKSSISNMVLNNILLAKTTEGCLIKHVTSNVGLIKGTATGCQFQNCLVIIDSRSDENPFGGIAYKLDGGSTVERCFVCGKISHYVPSSRTTGFFAIAAAIGVSSTSEARISAIAVESDESTIKECAIGDMIGISGIPVVGKSSSNTVLEKNISIESNRGCSHWGLELDTTSDINGQFIASVLFTQHYFEHTLGWDFDTVWQWDDANNRPALRPVSARTAGLTPEPAAASANTIDLLTQQIRANLWL